MLEQVLARLLQDMMDLVAHLKLDLNRKADLEVVEGQLESRATRAYVAGELERVESRMRLDTDMAIKAALEPMAGELRPSPSCSCLALPDVGPSHIRVWQRPSRVFARPLTGSLPGWTRTANPQRTP